ncbi:MAG: hypothetical protein JW839_07090 [Candidatus Lokiarchaeota archaeon]|nr:hypothetical protein [Candidatus Lokiarchaeota archaeon]
MQARQPRAFRFAAPGLDRIHPTDDNPEEKPMILDISTLELNVFYALSVILVSVKLCLLAFLCKKEIDHVKSAGKSSFGFASSVIFLLACLVVARLVYMQFDFVLTKFDPSTYYLDPAVWYWKAATLVASIGFAVFMFVTDYRIFRFKFKGIFAYMIAAFAACLFFLPVHSKPDFEFVSLFLLSANCVTIVLPVFFLYMGRQRSPYQVPSLLIAFGIITYAVGATITTETILAVLPRMFIYLSSLVLKIAGLVMFAYGVSRFATKFSRSRGLVSSGHISRKTDSGRLSTPGQPAGSYTAST